MISAIDTIYSVKTRTRKGEANIRRVNVNAAPMGIDKLRKLHEVGMGTFQVFQETYDRRTYARVHPAGTIKGDFDWRLYCHHRAMDAGIDDVGIGALFGLADWRFDVLGLLSHSRELERRCNGVGAHTISFPRLEPASNAPGLDDASHRVSDEDFLKLITILRLSVPYTGLICTAREPALIRNEAVRRGITQMDAGTRIGLGAYSEEAAETSAADRGMGDQDIDNQQFILGDTRSLEELIGYLADMGHITSFCTAGYRIGRTGGRIMRMLRDCAEGEFCKLNAILTFREWLDDFASPETSAKGEALIAGEYAEAKERLPRLMPKFEPMYEKTKHGCRDLYL
jgi:2-iminoacetate synthase